MKKLFYAIRSAIQTKILLRLSFLFLGIASTLWFLIRVIPKPSRATYPCMRVAAPLMSGFVIYLVSLGSTVLVFRKFRNSVFNRKYRLALPLLFIGIGLVYFTATINVSSTKAITVANPSVFTANDPVGVGKGIHPGRVVWVWDNKATDETCTNSSGDWWFLNTDQTVVDTMLAQGIRNLAGETNNASAWDAIFRHFNSNHGKGDVGYTAGEKVFVKINLTNSCCNTDGYTTQTSNFHRMDATPEMVLSILKQLVEEAGVAESDIYIGDPFRTFRDNYWELCTGLYPNVVYVDGKGNYGRHQTVPTTDELFKSSNGLHTLRIPQEYVNSAYFINMPCLKSHDTGGITLAAKNHQGSVLQDGVGSDDQSMMEMHDYMPQFDGTYGEHRYRHLVDYMGHEELGGKTLLAIIDGIWAGKSWEGFVEKWQMAPFNNDYPSSIFLSQDMVAIESVCWDFFRAEYANYPENEKYPYWEGIEDYMHQAADPNYWPDGVEYDPEGDGSLLGSMGIFEHWDNATNMSYTGIDFVKINLSNANPGLETPGNLQDKITNIEVYPNPASDYVYVEYNLKEPAAVKISLIDSKGSLVAVLQTSNLYSGSQQLYYALPELSSGLYYIQLDLQNNGHSESRVKKLQVY